MSWPARGDFKAMKRSPSLVDLFVKQGASIEIPTTSPFKHKRPATGENAPSTASEMPQSGSLSAQHKIPRVLFQHALDQEKVGKTEKGFTDPHKNLPLLPSPEPFEFRESGGRGFPGFRSSGARSPAPPIDSGQDG